MRKLFLFLTDYMRKLELLAPARNAEVGRIAILAGADAVYIGAPAFGARAAAGNSVCDIAALAEFAHRYRSRVYVTMNTILFDNELEDAANLVRQLYAAGVDALIVQDMAYLEMNLPPIALHASTQCDIRTPAKAAMLAKAGFSQLVLPREFSTDQIRACADASGVPVEVFVHGALCVSYSGDCQAGCVAMGRSANRGVCPQMCRLPYELVDKDGRVVAPEKHYLSLRDLNQSENLEELIKAGASSFKIEGRLKDGRYVANVTAAYSRALDAIIARTPGLCRASYGRSATAFVPDLARTFNRGYTNYFLHGRPAASLRMASLDTPKWAGMPVGVVSAPYDRRRKSFVARLSADLANGDGLGYFDADGKFNGFRLNKVEGNVLYPATPLDSLKAGMKLYSNNDKAFFDILDRPDASCTRTLEVRFMLENVDEAHFSIKATDERGCSVTCVIDSDYSEAKQPQEEARRRALEKLGGTIYRCAEVEDKLGNRFVPLSSLADARRRVLSELDMVAAATYSYDRRSSSRLAADEFATLSPLTYHDNISNRYSRHFYESHGARIESKALEVSPVRGEDLTVMTTRYCIRRELGACLREKGGSRLPSPLFLKNPSGIYRLDFDCASCGMKVVKIGSTRV